MDTSTLSWAVRIAYGVGHVLNDLCSAMWFLYFLLFLTHVEKLSDKMGATILLNGQIFDALLTPIIGAWSDRGNLGWFTLHLGRRKSWYLLGTITVAVPMPFLYTPAIGLHQPSASSQVIYYSVFALIFQFGWASVQTIHLAMSTDLTPLDNERTLLLSLRNTMTSVSTLVVPCIYLIINTVSYGDHEVSGHQFMALVSAVLCIGLACSAFTLIFVQDKRRSQVERQIAMYRKNEPRRTMIQIFGRLDFYKIGVVYTFSRVFANCLQTFVAMYVCETLNLHSRYAAAVPLSIYAAGTASSLLSERMIVLLGRKITYIIGSLIGVVASVWIGIGPASMEKVTFAFLVFTIYGISSSILIVTAISLTSAFIADDFGNGGLIFGVMSFCDKLVCGIVIFTIQQLKHPGVPLFYKHALAYICGSSALFGTLTILTIYLPTDGTESLNEQKQSKGKAVNL